jgi:hypothetical protein
MICEASDDLALTVNEFLRQRSEFSLSAYWDRLFNYPCKNPEFPYG